MSNKFFGLIELIMKFIFEKILKLNLSQDKYDALIQFVKFGIVGVSNTVVSYVIYVVSLLTLQKAGLLPEIDYLVAQFVGFVLSVLWSFYWNNKFVFQDNEGKRNLWQALLKTYMSYAFTGLFLNSILSLLWVEVFHWSKMIAPIINLLVSVPLNFIMNKFWAFK
jgi:putative flippase GtrA